MAKYACRICAVPSDNAYCPVHTYKPSSRRRPDRGGSTRQWRKLRETVLERDGHKCQWPDCPEVGTHVDHILPVSKGGTDDLSNLQTLCEFHNLRKSDTAQHNIAKAPEPLPLPKLA